MLKSTTRYTRILFLLSFVLLGHAVAGQNKFGPTTADLYYHPLPANRADYPPIVLTEFAAEMLIQELQYPKRFTVERQKIHKAILLEYLRRYQPKNSEAQKSPVVAFTGGPYGSGKNYLWGKFSEHGLVDASTVFNIDVDDLRPLLPEYEALYKESPEKATTLLHDEAIVLADFLLDFGLKKRWNICFQSSLKDYVHYNPLFERIIKTYPNARLVMLEVVSDLISIALTQKDRKENAPRKPPDEYVIQSMIQSPDTIPKLKIWPHFIFRIDNRNKAAIIESFSWRQTDGTLQEVKIGLHVDQIKDYPKTFPLQLPEESAHWKHVIFDIDHTLFDLNVTPQNQWQYIEASSPRPGTEELEPIIHYRLLDLVAELTQKIIEHPNAKISFVSGGPYVRNLELLKKTKLPILNGKSLYDIAYRIQSNHDLILDPSADEHADFSIQYQKPYDSVTQHLNRSIRIDDQKGWLQKIPLGGIYLGQLFEFGSSMSDFQQTEPSIYLPNSNTDIFISRNIMAGVASIVLPWLDDPRNNDEALQNFNFHAWESPLEQYFSIL
jgi:hypothetical protein